MMNDPAIRSSVPNKPGGAHMETDLRELKEVLRKENDEFRLLMESHATCEARLRELQGKSFLNDDEKLEEVTIKKKKLHLKDKMEAMIQHYKNGNLPVFGSR
jgi:uncharacterized protein YdcH (DUF465 family)